MLCPLPSMVIVIGLSKLIVYSVVKFSVSVMVVSSSASAIAFLRAVHEFTVVSFFRLLFVFFCIVFYQLSIFDVIV